MNDGSVLPQQFVYANVAQHATIKWDGEPSKKLSHKLNPIMHKPRKFQKIGSQMAFDKCFQ